MPGNRGELGQIHPFDAATNNYDDAFTDTRLALWLRAMVQEYLRDAFQQGDHVLELGCGTGEDAIWLAEQGIRVTATDASSVMLAVAQEKSRESRATHLVEFVQLDMRNLHLCDSGTLQSSVNVPGTLGRASHLGERMSPTHLSKSNRFPNSDEMSQQMMKSQYFDGAFSNFGPLNCLADRRHVAAGLARWVRPGGRLVLVVMGPVCPWEIGWHLLRGQPGVAFRRLRSGVDAHVGDGKTIQVWYPSPRRLVAEFKPHFRLRQLIGLGVLLPPSYLNHLVGRLPTLFQFLASAERRLNSFWPWTQLNDHYLVVLERR